MEASNLDKVKDTMACYLRFGEDLRKDEMLMQRGTKDHNK
jgi:hypothetical protein